MNHTYTLRQALHALFFEASKTAFEGVTLTEDQIEITQSTDLKFGHYQCNSAMKLIQRLNRKPREIAEAWVGEIQKNSASTMIEKITIAGPGFINVEFSSECLASHAMLLLKDLSEGRLRCFRSIEKAHDKVVIDFSSPNIAKEMHVGHLRSTIIGDCLARTFEFLGYDVLRLNHIGDWGTAFGMLIAYLKAHAKGVLAGEVEVDLPQLMAWYKASKKVFDEDPEFKKQSQQEVVALQSGDPLSLKAWGIICEISRRAYQQIYDLLDIRITERGESFYNPFLPDIIADLSQKKLLEISDGATCMFLEGFENREGDPLPFMLQKSDGGYNYATTDMAAMRHRVSVEKAKRIIIVTDAGQSAHFAMLSAAAKKAGYLNPEETIFNHVPFGLVLGPDGKKFKTRSGETEKLIDLISAAIAEAKKILIEREVESDPRLLDEMAQTLGVNAIKYSDLCANRTGDYVFSYERMLKFEGNTAAFLMYSYVRINGIKRKIGLQGDLTFKGEGDLRLTHPSEVFLALHLNQFPEILVQLSEELYPHRLTEYLYGLAERFNAFFRDCRVEGDPLQSSRLILCEITAKVMSTGMKLLGLSVIDRM
jgi:arginyl-tRNA synthetase